MPSSSSLLTATLCLVLASPVRAQGAAKKPIKSKSAPTKFVGPTTLLGVYTEEQAGRGRDVYMGSCKSCHTPASHTGATFNQWWRGHPLSDLYGFVATKMPKNDPGSLDPGDAADVVAYLLKMNAMPAGKSELPADMDSLAHVRIETKHGSTSTPAKRKKP